MNGTIMVTYKILCKADLNKEILIDELLLNEKVAKIIKSEFAKGFRNINLLAKSSDAKLIMETTKEHHSFEVAKDDFADILVLAEEDAASKKLFKKDCERVELIDIETRA
ncbi:MAG: hypothetical protein DRG78_14910 [Epsilonproteobacteria bacterium]|nr:MAG: hypothetical protein DRG78_14910 [Campylobacterota bacterium]